MNNELPRFGRVKLDPKSMKSNDTSEPALRVVSRSLLAPFWVHFVTFWCHFGSLLDTLEHLFGTLGGSWRAQGPLGRPGRIFKVFGSLLVSILGSLLEHIGSFGVQKWCPGSFF